jgi:hypothetical protein
MFDLKFKLFRNFLSFGRKLFGQKSFGRQAQSPINGRISAVIRVLDGSIYPG